MFRTLKAITVSLVCAAALAAADTPPGVRLSAADVVDKNVAARGGMAAWRAVQTMTLSGKLGAGGNQRATPQLPTPGGRSGAQSILPARPVEELQLPFTMDLKRPRKMRFELQFAGQTGVQVFDSAKGWKLRLFLNRRGIERSQAGGNRRCLRRDFAEPVAAGRRLAAAALSAGIAGAAASNPGVGGLPE